MRPNARLLHLCQCILLHVLRRNKILSRCLWIKIKCATITCNCASNMTDPPPLYTFQVDDAHMPAQTPCSILNHYIASNHHLSKSNVASITAPNCLFTYATYTHSAQQAYHPSSASPPLPHRALDAPAARCNRAQQEP